MNVLRPPASGLMRKADVWLVPERRVHHMADLEEARVVFSGIYSESKLEPSRGLAFSCELKVITCGSIRIVHGIWPTGGRCTIPQVLGRYLGNGDGTFQSAVDYPVTNGATDLEIADFNGDGRADVAGTLFNSNAVGVLLGNGDGTLQPAINFATGAGPFTMAVGDLNGDGKRDIVTANFNGNSGSVLLNTSH